MKYQLVIFDFDGTIADTFPWLVSVFSIVARRYNFKDFQKKDLESLRTYSARHLFRKAGIPFWKIPFIVKHVLNLMDRDIGKIPMFPEMDRVMYQLAEQGYTLALVTANSRKNVQAVLGPTLCSKIAHFECGVSMFGKTAKLKKVLRQSGVKASTAICIGDELRDAEAAKKAGIAFGAVSWGYTESASLKKNAYPAIMFDSVESIVPLLTPSLQVL
jgi:phosphoglycolate phosphatase